MDEKGRIWQIKEDKRLAIVAAKERVIRKQQKEKEEAVEAAVAKSKVDAAAAVVKRREDGREALHQRWARHQAHFEKQCAALAAATKALKSIHAELKPRC